MNEREPSSSSSELCGEGDVCDGNTQNNHQENDEMHRSSLLKGDGYDETIHLQQLSANAQDLLPSVSLALIFFSLMGWFFFRHIKHRKEWQQASNLQLKQICQRNMKTDLQLKKEEKSKIKATSKQTDTTTRRSSSSIIIISSSTCKETPKLDKETVRSIRAQQQKQHDIKAKLAKQQRRHVDKEKKRLLYESLQHEVADQAYARRRKLISEEQSMLQANLQSEAQTNELEEMERRELLHEQNFEYEESLRQDQERLMQATIETERCRKMARALQDSISRLERAGICTADLPTIEHNNNKATVEISADDKILVRLMFPSGKRVQAAYSKSHSIGLIYDLALVILNYNKQDPQAEVSTQEEASDNQSEQMDRNIWKELFESFTIKTTFPPQTFEDMDLTLEQCGFQQGFTLMVIVESD